ncbi:MAG: type IV pilus secretin PilQ [Bdellovibrio sp.]|nr:type IV pilus secretin PilQ [Bdellovibrio sp.]
MNGFIRLLIVSAMIANMTACASSHVQDDLSLDEGLDNGSEVAATSEAPEGSDEFSEFEDKAQDQAAQEHAPSTNGDQDLAIEDEINQASGGGSEQVAQEPAAPEQPETPPVADVPAEDPFANTAIDTPAPAPQAPAPEVPAAAPEPTHETVPVASNGAPATITDLKFKANDNGGTIIVQADRPLTYTTRSNTDLHQYIVEVENAVLPERLKRSLNTRDIRGAVGAIDAYQNPGSTTARFVIQMREGVSEPAVQAEGSNLLIVAAGTASTPVAEHEQVTDVGGDGQVLPNQNLTEFLAGNTKFYGKKISIETSNMDIRDALNLITEESGVNMVISDEVKGNVSLKLRQVPWDQALVVLMRARKLGYTRQGNVLRIAPLQDLKTEEDDANKLALARKNLEPLKVRMFPVSYAKVDELEKKIKDFLGERGKVVGDIRTNSLVVTDIAENLERVAKLIVSLDTQPSQVLIEGKIVEASEQFTRNIGVSWSASGQSIKLGSTSRGPVNMTPRFSVNPGASTGTNFNFNLDVGTLDVFGSISAALALSETENKVKTLSAPRILTMSNEKADINTTTEVPVKQVTVTGNSQQTSYQFKPLTLKLEVTPQVTADGSVMMKVAVNRQIRGAPEGDGSFSVNSREANTRVLVKNGQTAVIGGIYQSDATDGENGVPWLRDLPIVGNLFKLQSTTKDKSELLIFLTPRIMGQVDNGSMKNETQDF